MVLNGHVQMVLNGFLNGLLWHQPRGPHFDIPMIDDVCRDMEIDSPFPWYAIRDVRSIIDTIYGTTNGYPPNKKEFLNRMSSEHSLVKHNALHDCIIDALMIQEAYEGIEYE